jgi:hypothetical protein
VQSTIARRTFLVLLAAVALIAALTYQNWWGPRSNPVQYSDRLVREFAAAAGAEVTDYRRALNAITVAPGRTPDAVAAARAAIEARTQEALRRVETNAEATTARIKGVSGISIHTQDNRLDRLQQRRREATQSITDIAAAAQASLLAPATP